MEVAVKVRRLLKGYYDSKVWRAVGATGASAAALLLGVQIETFSESFKDNVAPLAVLYGGVLIVAVVYALIKTVLLDQIEEEEREQRAHEDAIGFARQEVERIGIQLAQEVEEATTYSELVQVTLASKAKIQQIIVKCHDVLASQYGRSDRLRDKVSFEATFMTKSYLDQEITIACWANSDRLEPPSLRKRSADPKTYEKTVTADMYRDEVPRLAIIGTSKGHPGFKSLYAGQEDRIRSMAVMPVLAPSRTLLGTIVVHCDKPGFFMESHRRYWREFLEVFARRIMVEKHA